MFRAVRLDDAMVTLECGDEIGFMIELCDTFRVTREEGDPRRRRAGSLANIWLTPPGQTTRITFHGTARIAQFALPLQLAAAVAAELEPNSTAKLDLLRRSVRKDWRLFHLICRAAAAVGQVSQAKALRDVVAHLLLHYVGQSREAIVHQAGISPLRLNRVREYVDANLSGVTVAAMAVEAELSSFHFAREFKRITGEAPWFYVTSRRLTHAMRLLAQRDLPLEVVAHRAGFANASHMSRRMRERIGCSPVRARSDLLP